MMRVMLDSDRLDVILACDGLVPLLATYSDLVPDLSKFALRHSRLVLIDRGMGDPTGKATVADVERGALSVNNLLPWIEAKEKAGLDNLTAYVNRANLAQADAAASGKNFYRWIATLDGTCTIQGFPTLRGPAAVQALGAGQVGIHADLSLVYEDQWNRTSEITAAEILPAEQAVASALASLHKITG